MAPTWRWTQLVSSLAAVHLAVQSLRNGESNLALAGGVNVILTPHFTMMTSKMRMLSSDGRCKAFDSRADGIGRGEGSGVVVLKEIIGCLERRRSHPCIDPRFSYQPGWPLKWPDRPQRPLPTNRHPRCIENAGVKPEQVSYVETHGTGTPLGDPIEVEALSEVYGSPHPHAFPASWDPPKPIWAISKALPG